ncbi:MAG: hypothetical protein ACFFDN_37445 [Candidatus Hodarchaeota archaeon]
MKENKNNIIISAGNLKILKKEIQDLFDSYEKFQDLYSIYKEKYVIRDHIISELNIDGLEKRIERIRRFYEKINKELNTETQFELDRLFQDISLAKYELELYKTVLLLKTRNIETDNYYNRSRLDRFFVRHLGYYTLAIFTLLASLLGGVTIIGSKIQNAQIERIEKAFIEKIEQTINQYRHYSVYDSVKSDSTRKNLINQIATLDSNLVELNHFFERFSDSLLVFNEYQRFSQRFEEAKKENSILLKQISQYDTLISKFNIIRQQGLNKNIE